MEGRQNPQSLLLPYNPPEWAKSLPYLPKYKLKLAHANTPIQKWNLPGVPGGFSVHIKRDDMTGSTLTGNKIRKLEFLLADAIDAGCRHVITCGGIQSNHCRATALACAQLGLTSHLVLRVDVKETSEVTCKGNVLLDRLCGANIYIAPDVAPYKTELLPREERLSELIKQKTGEKSYLIPVGGTNKVGMFGYLSVFEELMSQGLHENFDDIVFTCGSGGTAAGLAIANLYTGSKLKVHCIAVSDNAQFFHANVQEILDDIGLGDIKSEDILEIIDGHQGIGYALSTTEELEFIRDVCVRTGVVIDPAYTGKGSFGLMKELQRNPQRFQGKRILFVHTGGMFGLFDGRMESVLKQDNSTSNRIKLWPNKDMNPTC